MAKKKILCPYCFKHFWNVDAEYQCNNTELDLNQKPVCPKEVDEKFSKHWGRDVERGHFFKNKTLSKSLFGATPEPAACDVCGTMSNRFVCPHCHNWLPTSMIEDGSEIISIIGERNSGKTTYFTTLISELEDYGDIIGLSVSPCSESPDKNSKTSAIYKSNRDRLFVMKTILDQTQKSKKQTPLIFRLDFTPKDKKKCKSVYLVFYDTAGEVFHESDTIEEMAQYLSESSGVIMLLDPYQIDKIKEALELDDSKDDVADSGGMKVLQTLRTSLAAKGKDAINKMKSKPLAIAFSKIDAVVNALAEQNEQIAGIDLKKNSSFLDTGYFSLGEIKLCDNGISKFLKDYRVKNVKFEATNNLFEEDKVMLFGVSALGAAPDENDNLTKVVPYRVLDPLVWILHKTGFDIPLE